jgi:hypothetical protein
MSIFYTCELSRSRISTPKIVSHDFIRHTKNRITLKIGIELVLFT